MKNGNRMAALAPIWRAWSHVFFTAAEVNQGRSGSLPYMTAVQNFTATADLPGLIAYLGIIATLLAAVAWASYRDRQKEGQKKRALAAKAAVAENGKAGRAVADVKQRRAA